MNPKINAWRASLFKGALLCRDNGHHGDASTLDDISAYLLEPLPVDNKLSQSQTTKIFELIRAYADAKAKIMMSSVDELSAGSEFTTAADTLRTYMVSITEA